MKFLWLFDQDAVQILPILIAALWALGGSGIKPIRGFGVPILFVLSAISTAHCLSGSILAGISMHFALRLSYGDAVRKRLGRYYWPAMFCVGFAWTFSLAPYCVCAHRWLSLVGGSLGSAFILPFSLWISQRFKLPWKPFELLIGGWIGWVMLRLIF